MMGGGPGYGPGHGYGPGRGAGDMPGALNLSDEQRDKIAQIREENREKNWGAMGQLRSEMFKLRRLYAADNADASAVADQQKKVDELRRQMLKSRLESRAQVESILTPEQKKVFRQYRPWWFQDNG
jgi:Spy/CpxP family protein refolding chaperone